MGDPKSKKKYENYTYIKRTVKGKIYLNTLSKITRLVISGSKNYTKIERNTLSKITRLVIGDSKNYTKIERKYGKGQKSAEIDIYKDNFSDMDIPGIILFRTEKINEDILYYQCDSRKNKSYYMLQKTLNKPEFELIKEDEIDEDEDMSYFSMLKMREDEQEEKNSRECYIFLLDQSGSMWGERINLSCKALLLFLQSLNIKSSFQLIGFGSDFKFFSEKPLEYNKKNIRNLMNIIKTLGADRGSTELSKPLEEIYRKEIYNEFEGKNNIILLTDGYVFDKEKVIDLIGANSKRFIFNSIGIGECDKDLIERAALIGNGYSYYISDLSQLNYTVISLLDKTPNALSIDCITNQKCSIEDDNKKQIKYNDYLIMDSL